MMRRILVPTVLLAAGLASQAPVGGQATDRMNPVIALHEKGRPVFGIAHPSIGRGNAPAAGVSTTTTAPPAPTIVLSDVAKETVDYKRADYFFTSGTSDTFLRYIEEIRKAGGSVRTHPFAAKIGIWHRDPTNVGNAIVRQLNAGHSIVLMEAVESAQEVRDVIKAVRFAASGGTRPDAGLENAAAYWGLTVDQYKRKADVWPLNKNGELLVNVIVESMEGLEHVREIAAEPGVGEMFAGYGTLGGVFRGDPAGREAAAAKILAACKEFKLPCGFPVNNPAEMEQRMKEGWSVFIMQRWNEAAFNAVETGRTLAGR
jgi:4-hydroxy-2-oxoheptanedioate aldolase